MFLASAFGVPSALALTWRFVGAWFSVQGAPMPHASEKLHEIVRLTQLWTSQDFLALCGRVLVASESLLFSRRGVRMILLSASYPRWAASSFLL